MYYLSSENKGADQLRGNREADLRPCFRLSRLLVFHEAAHLSFQHFTVLSWKGGGSRAKVRGNYLSSVPAVQGKR